MANNLKDKAEREFITGSIDPSTILVPTYVKAGAGAGKTTSIKDRVLNLILHHNISPKKMVIITYTVKAAEELSTRIREVVESELKKDISKENREKLNLALNELSLARISTVHSFCHDLLLEYPIEFMIDPRAKILDNRATKALAEACQNEFLKHHTMQEGSHYEAHKEAFEAYKTLEELVEKPDKIFEVFQLLYKNRDMTPKQVDFSFEGREEIESSILGNFETLIAKLHEADCVCKDREDKLFQAHKGYLEYSANINVISDFNRYKFPRTLFPLTQGNAKNWPKEWYIDFKQVRTEFRSEFDEYKFLAEAEKYKYLVTAYKGFANLVDNYKKANGVIDFFDCLLIVKNGLTQNKFLRESIQKRFGVLVIDEFQDSDPIQAEIATLLAEDSPGKLLFVGDGKQSIYGFARADIDVFRSMESYVVDDVKGLSKELTTNFRSKEKILDFINEQFSVILKTDYSKMHVSPENKGDVGKVEVIGLNISLSTDEKAANVEVRRDRESFLICNKIKEMIDSKNYVPKDFLVLFRTGTAMNQYEETLMRLNIPVQNSKSKDNLKKEQALEILSLMGYFLFPKDAFFELSLKNSSLCSGLIPESIINISKDSNCIKNRLRVAISELGLTHAAKVLNDATYLEVTEYLLETFDIEVELTNGNHTQAYLHMLERAGQEGYSHDKENDERVYYEKLAPDCVRLMTIHTSKGLEAKVVILIAHDATDRLGNKVCIDRAKKEVYPENPFITDKTLEKYTLDDLNDLLGNQELKRLEEEKRVLYVACTRAEEELYLVYNEEMKISVFLEPLKESIGSHPHRSKISFAEFEDKFAKLPKFFKPEQKSTSEILFSKDAFESIAKAKAGTPAVTTLISKPDLFRSSKGRGMEFGSFTHKVMEVLSFALNMGISVDLDAIISKVMDLEDFTPESKHRDDLKQALDRFLKSDTAKMIKEAKNIHSEISFSLPTEYHGIIDLVVETKGGSLVVVDFKTDVLADSEGDKEIKGHYKKQIELYVKAVAELTQKVVTGECCYLF